MHNLDWLLKKWLLSIIQTSSLCASLCTFAHWSRFNLCLQLSRGFIAGLRQRKPISQRRRKVVAVETSRPKNITPPLGELGDWRESVSLDNLAKLSVIFVGLSSSVSHMLLSLSKQQHWWHGRRRPSYHPHGLHCLFAAFQQHEEREWDFWDF